MRLDLENLPTDTALLHQLVREMAGFVEARDGEIERLKTIIKQLQRAQFGRRSEKLNLQIASGNLIFEDLETEAAVAKAQAPAAMALHCKAERKPLPAHLPRDERILRPDYRRSNATSSR